MIPKDLAGKDLFHWLMTNKKFVIDSKKASVKIADAVSFYTADSPMKNAYKDYNASEDVHEIKRQLIINTTYWKDSHDDVHIDGLWNKTLADNDIHYLIKQHVMTFENIIDDSAKAYTRKIAWRELGVDFDGKTEALIFDATITVDRNAFMFNQYRKGYVKNHSVGMRYFDLSLAINDGDFKEEYAEWNRHINKIANKEAAESSGYFFAVKQAGIIEGSAVVKGSNPITPVYGESKSDIITFIEPVKTTPEMPRIDADKLSRIFTNIKI